MNSQQNGYFETWVRQEQIAYWLIALLLMAISVAAFLFFKPDGALETNLGPITVDEAPSLNLFGYLIFAMPALSGLFILWWTSDREHVRALTSSVMRHQVYRWAGLGIIFAIFGAVQIFDAGSVMQNIVIAPSLLIFGLFALFRSYKIWGFRALGKIN